MQKFFLFISIKFQGVFQQIVWTSQLIYLSFFFFFFFWLLSGTEFEFPAALAVNWEPFTHQHPHLFGFGVYGTNTMFLPALCIPAGEEGGAGSVVTGAADGIGDAHNS